MQLLHVSSFELVTLSATLDSYRVWGRGGCHLCRLYSLMYDSESLSLSLSLSLTPYKSLFMFCQHAMTCSGNCESSNIMYIANRYIWDGVQKIHCVHIYCRHHFTLVSLWEYKSIATITHPWRQVYI